MSRRSRLIPGGRPDAPGFNISLGRLGGQDGRVSIIVTVDGQTVLVVNDWREAVEILNVVGLGLSAMAGEAGESRDTVAAVLKANLDQVAASYRAGGGTGI